MYTTHYVDDLEQYRALCSQITPESGYAILFRGQTREYKVADVLSFIPAAFRGSTQHKSLKTDCLETMWRAELLSSMQQWRLDELRLEARGVHTAYDGNAWEHSDAATPATAPAVGQQYAAFSSALDLTACQDVALWFALHACERDSQGASFGPTAESRGFVYVFECLEPRRGWRLPEEHSSTPASIEFVAEVYDLRRIFFGDETSRPVRQKAMIYLPNESLEPSHNSCFARLRHRFVISGSLIREGASKLPLSIDDLFPGPREDRYLRWLMADNGPEVLFSLTEHWSSFDEEVQKLVKEEMQAAQQIREDMERT